LRKKKTEDWKSPEGLNPKRCGKDTVQIETQKQAQTMTKTQLQSTDAEHSLKIVTQKSNRQIIRE